MLRRNGPVVKSVESVLTLVTVSDSAKNRTFRSSLTACGNHNLTNQTVSHVWGVVKLLLKYVQIYILERHFLVNRTMTYEFAKLWVACVLLRF